jgi:tetratricopeptide (TPR) repeat protein
MKSNYFRSPCQTIRRRIGISLFIFLSVSALAQTTFSKAEDLFLRNKPQDALAYLEKAVAEDPANIKAALYLGITYQQLGRADDAIAALRKLLPRSGDQTALVAFNLGNVYFSKGAATFAEQYYTQAIQADGNFSSAFLNRANSRIKTGALKDAVSDYQTYLTLEPSSPKRPQIEKLLALIQDQFAAEEHQKAVQEATAKAEEERRKKLLEEVSSSLQGAADETKGLQAGSEDVKTYDGQFELQ